jgi:hypothetical protein
LIRAAGPGPTAGIAVRPARAWGRAKPAKEAIPDTPADSNPAKEVISDSASSSPSWSPTASACEVHRDVIEEASHADVTRTSAPG